MKRRILRGEVDLQDAKSSESNMLVELDLPKRERDFFEYLYESRHVIAITVAQHMNASRPPSCEVFPSNKWKLGSFNICIPVSVLDHPIERVLIRFPLPYKIGELHFPGNTDEKLITEAATYAWLDEHCPEVPKPRLLGYALSDGRLVIISSWFRIYLTNPHFSILGLIICLHLFVYSNYFDAKL